MATLAENIKKYRKANRFTQKSLAEELGIAPTAVSAWELGRNKPLMDNVEHMATLFGISKSQLLGDDFTSLSSPTPQVLELDRELKDPRHSEWISLGEKLLKEQEAEKSKVVPIFEDKEEKLHTVQGITFTAAAIGLGHGYEADDYDTYTVYTTEEPPRRYDYAIGIRGDSMLPKYHSGDMLYIIDKGVSSYSGQLCVVVHNGQTYFKKVYTEPDGLRLVSLNTKYDDIFIDYPPAEDTYIKIYDVVGSFTPIDM